MTFSKRSLLSMSTSSSPQPTAPDRHAATGRAGAAGPWTDTLGLMATRCAQVLLIAAVASGLLWLLVRVGLVVIAAIVALILASAAHPLVGWLIRRRWSPLLATIATFLATLIVLGGVVTGIVFAVRDDWEELSRSAIGGWEELQRVLRTSPLPVDTASIDAALQQVTAFITSGTFLGGALSSLGAATGFVTGAVLMIVVLFFFLKDGPMLWSFTLRWFRGETRAKLAESGDRTVQLLGGYVRGTATIAAVDALFIGVPLAILGVPLAVPLAVIVFVGAFVPIVGATVAGALAALVALVTSGPVVALVVIAIVVLVNQLEGNLLQPIVMGRALSLHSLVVLLALAVGTIVGGFFGAVLAVPLTAVAWSVIQIWTDTYQVGDDPVLGEDPLSATHRAAAKATIGERWKYQRMRRDAAPTELRTSPSNGRTDGTIDPSGASRDGATVVGSVPAGAWGRPAIEGVTMPRPVVSIASTAWKGDLLSGSGTATLETSQLGTFDLSWKARSEESAKGTTSPEELLGAAHAACYSMQFSNMLAENGTPPTSVDTSAAVTFNIGEGGITGIALSVTAEIEGIEDADFQRLADEAKSSCPVSKALAGVDITLEAKLA